MAGTRRMAPLPEAERDDAAAELLAGVGVADGRTMNIFTTLVRHPRLFRHWVRFGGALLSGALPPRQRELLILRTAHNTGAAYEWAHHVDFAHAAGLSDEEIARVRSGPDDPAWDPFDAVLLTAADELHHRAVISDETWTALAAGYDDRQLIEVPMVVGQYHLVAFTLNSLGIELEPGHEAT